MTTEDFRQNYAHLTDDQLGLILADKKDLVPEALAAIEDTIAKRGVTLPEEPVWKRNAYTEERVHSLEDYPEYLKLTRKKRRWLRYGRLLALLFAGCWIGVAERTGIEGISTIVIFGMGFFGILGYVLNLVLRVAAYRCPQCGKKFGRESECSHCSFPRSLATAKA